MRENIFILGREDNFSFEIIRSLDVKENLILFGKYFRLINKAAVPGYVKT